VAIKAKVINRWKHPMSLSRRDLLTSAVMLGFASRAQAAEPFPVDMKLPGKLDYKFKRRETEYDASVPPGTIVVDNAKRLLFHVHSPGLATRYGVSVGKGSKAWSGEVNIAKMTEWPRWFPAPYHIAIKPELQKWLPDGMPGGTDNPLGARAMYLYKGNVDTVNRIHGAAKFDDIGKKNTAGCIGMLDGDIVHLYANVTVGTKVVMV
jgi:lipoprotein-anchoring transpeptidase ErfK/SrfK